MAGLEEQEREERLKKIKMDSREGNKVELITYGDNKVESDLSILLLKKMT
jgi:hypothetical protein